MGIHMKIVRRVGSNRLSINRPKGDGGAGNNFYREFFLTGIYFAFSIKLGSILNFI